MFTPKGEEYIYTKDIEGGADATKTMVTNSISNTEHSATRRSGFQNLIPCLADLSSGEVQLERISGDIKYPKSRLTSASFSAEFPTKFE